MVLLQLEDDGHELFSRIKQNIVCIASMCFLFGWKISPNQNTNNEKYNGKKNTVLYVQTYKNLK